MPNEPFLSPQAAETLRQVQQKLVRGASYSPTEYERDVTQLLNQLFPFSILPGVRLFSSEPAGRIAYGFEMDNLLHLRFGGVDYIVIVEAKKQTIRVEKNRWLVQYDGEDKCTREQLDNHIRTMWEYLEPIARNTELKFVAIVASSDARTIQQKADGFRNAEQHLCAIGALPQFLDGRFNFRYGADHPLPEVLRVPQSSFLDLLRLSLPVEQLGHPELASAIRYVDRCRRTLDETLFLHFAPKPERWAINGSAGMGKSVLLAYVAAVLSSGYELYRSLGEIGVKKAGDTFAAIGFDPDPTRGSIAIMAMSAKQLENIRSWFNLFVGKFQEGDTEGAIRFRPPEFILCRAGASLMSSSRKWSALLVDEAHDLPPFAAREIAELYAKGGMYLVAACDRHQKLRVAGSEAKIIEGLDFSSKSTRLWQIYRNPAPVYLASLALMFRWFAADGPKVIPSLSQLRKQFGFEARTVGKDDVEVTIRSDAHPANSWSHTVATFPDVAAAYQALAKEKMGHKEVLWVRFSEEDPDFDYEQLNQRFTYHNCRSRDAHKISDKYIKGQDYPIVVIEGFPGFMDRFDARADEKAEAREGRMWAFRRELYLCASRATAFLYFVCNVAETPEVLRIRREIQHLVRATATPENPVSHGTRSWKFVIHRTAQTRNVDVFSDAADDNIVQEVRPEPIPSVARKPEPPVVAILPKVQPVVTQISSKTPAPPPKREVVDLIFGTETKKPTKPPAPPIRRAAPVREPVARSAEEPAKPVPLRKSPAPQPKKASKPVLQIPRNITVRSLAALLGVKPFVLIADLMNHHVFVETPNENLDMSLVIKICRKRGFDVEIEKPEPKTEVNA